MPTPIATPTSQRFASTGSTPVGNFGRGRGFRGPCYNCGQTGHPYRFCSVRQASAPVPEVPTSQEADSGSDRVKKVSSNGKLKNVYIPIQLYNRQTVLLLDTGCDTSIIGATLLPANTEVLPTSNTLLAANGSTITMEGECKILFQVAGKDFTAYAVVTRAVHEFILGIDFLTKMNVIGTPKLVKFCCRTNGFI